MVKMTLTEFLLARIAEDEGAARDAYYDGQRWVSEEEVVVAADKELDPVLYLDRKRDAHHAQNWPPARVLAECEAKRRLVRWCGQWGEPAFREPLAFLAIPYADHSDYREEWKP